MSAEQPNEVLDYEGLQDAFSRFNEASVKLESKYQGLLEESQRLRESLRRKEEEIKRQERLAMLGETAAAIAHEVRNPLGAIRLFVSLLRRDVADRPQSVELIDQIEASIANLDNVVTNILQFSKDTSGTFAPVNVHSIIQEQLLRFPSSGLGGATFNMTLHGNPFVVGSESALRQVFYNVFLNALQATQYRGKIQVSVDSNPTQLFVIIQDNGPGIPKELIGRVFEPFVTSKNEGTGLGLAIVKKIVEQHHGTITVTNDNGARFSMVFPRGESI